MAVWTLTFRIVMHVEELKRCASVINVFLPTIVINECLKTDNQTALLYNLKNTVDVILIRGWFIRVKSIISATKCSDSF